MKCPHYFLILFLVSICGCHKNNPCSYLLSTGIPIPAGFTISSTCVCGSGSLWKDYVGDTSYGGEVIFNATLDSAQYEWHIGSGTYTQQNFSLDFSNVPNGSVIPITLIVKETAATKCYFGDRTADTMTKNLTISRITKLYIGNWLGYYYDSTNKLLSDTAYLITIKNVYFGLAGYDSLPAIYGIKPYCDTTVSFLDLITDYKELLFEYYDSVDKIGPGGRALVDSTNNNINIFLQWNSPIPPNPHSIKIFKGKRQ